MDFSRLITILIAAVGLGVLIFVHELGHFLMAKLFGMRVEKFYIGFLKPLVRKQAGETEYGIGSIPLGGYVKISGMAMEEDLSPEEAEAARNMTREERLRLRSAHPESYWSKPIWQRVVVIAAGPVMNLLVAFLLIFSGYLYGLPEYGVTGVVGEVLPDTGASAAGLQAGDRLLSVNGVPSDDLEAMREELRSHPGEKVTLEVDQGGTTRTIVADVGRHEDTGQGLLGVQFGVERVGTRSLPPGEAFTESFSTIGEISVAIFVFLKDLFVSEEAREQVSSPIGIVAYSSHTIELGWGSYIIIVGFVSLQLAILNLLPLLPLDGGHVLFNLVEQARGRPLRKEVFEKISFIGLVIIIPLFILGLSNDIGRIAGEGFEINP